MLKADFRSASGNMLSKTSLTKLNHKTNLCSQLIPPLRFCRTILYLYWKKKWKYSDKRNFRLTGISVYRIFFSEQSGRFIRLTGIIEYHHGNIKSREITVHLKDVSLRIVSPAFKLSEMCLCIPCSILWECVCVVMHVY